MSEELEQPLKKPKFLITEKQRTLLLLVLLAFAIGFIFWMKSSYSTNFVEGF